MATGTRSCDAARMIVVQRVRVRWDATHRSAPEANRRRGLDTAVPLPPLPGAELVVHDVLADEPTGYQRRAAVRAGNLSIAHSAGLVVRFDGRALLVARTQSGYRFPELSWTPLFRLEPGQVGRWLANFTYTGHHRWIYESWAVHVSNGLVTPDRFTQDRPDHEVDQRTHLYGGRSRNHSVTESPEPKATRPHRIR